jgi:hypothetical protein
MDEVETIRREDLGKDLAWLAGFIDGEGCFYLGFNSAKDREVPRRTLRTLVLVGNTAIEPMIRITQILSKIGVGFTMCLNREPSNPKWSRAMQLKVCGQRRVYKLCKALEPHLTCKQEQARQMMAAIEYRWKLAESVGSNNRNLSLIEDPVLGVMSKRMKELNAYRPDLTAYSRQAGEVIRAKKPSTTTRLAALTEQQVSQMI